LPRQSCSVLRTQKTAAAICESLSAFLRDLKKKKKKKLETAAKKEGFQRLYRRCGSCCCLSSNLQEFEVNSCRPSLCVRGSEQTPHRPALGFA